MTSIIEATLASSLRAQWQLDDVLRADQELDFSRNFMPESLARTAALEHAEPVRAARPQPDQRASISEHLRRGRGVHPAVPGRSRAAASAAATTGGCARSSISRARKPSTSICSSASTHAFVRGFPVECQMIGPSEAIGAEILRHDPLAVGLVILMIEWMTPAALSRLDPRRRRPRSALQEPDEAPLDGGSAARQARHVDRRGARRGPDRGSRSTRRSTNSSRSAASSTMASRPRPASTSTRSRRRSAASSRTATRSSPSSTRPRAGPTSAPAWSTSASRARSKALSPNAARRIAEAAPVFA